MHKYVVTSASVDSDNILRLVLTPKRSRDKLEYRPGQYAAIGFRKNGRPSPMRCFSIVSSPYGTDELEFAIRVKGSFTRSLAELVPGSRVTVRGPYGHFTVDEHYSRNIVMLAGGIGITPFMSMIRASTYAHLPNRFFLLYSNPLHNHVPFQDELLEHERSNQMFGSVFFITRGDAVKRQGQRLIRGRISVDHLQQLTDGKLNNCIYFICGPKGFIQNYQKLLAKNGVSAERIVTEEFSTSASLLATFLPRERGVRLTYALATLAIVAGAIFFGALDLVRYVPAKLQADTLASRNVSSSSTSTSQLTTAPTGQAAPTSSATSTAPVQSTTTTTPAQTTVITPTPVTTQPPASTPVQTYQPPVTSVS